MNNFIYQFFILCLLILCAQSQDTIEDLPLPSPKYVRVPFADGSFGSWLRAQPLKDKGADVLDYRGRVYKKGSDTTVARVMSIDVSGRRMEQCMDILIRLYAEYLWQINETERISFPLPGGYWLNWSDWRNGWRPKFKSIHVTMMKNAQPDSSHHNLESYLRTIYANSHTQQFYYGYEPVIRDDVQGGDFIVLKGSKSHAVLIVDLARDSSDNYIALIGHGDTPACQFYLLKYNSEQIWFPLKFDNEILPLPIRRKMRWSGLRRFNQTR